MLARSPARYPEAFPSGTSPTPVWQGFPCKRHGNPCGSVWSFGFCPSPLLRDILSRSPARISPPVPWRRPGARGQSHRKKLPTAVDPVEPVLPYNARTETGATNAYLLRLISYLILPQNLSLPFLVGRFPAHISLIEIIGHGRRRDQHLGIRRAHRGREYPGEHQSGDKRGHQPYTAR